MRAIILAAGIGWRLGEQGRLMPKSLLEFGGESLLARHMRLLEAQGIDEVHVGVGYQADKMRAAVEAIETSMQVTTVFNPSFEQGNVVTLWALRDVLSRGPTLLMDADVLYDARMLAALVRSQHDNCFLLDRDLEPGDEPVKLCVRGTQLVEFGKQIPAGLRYDYLGESVGFFRLSAALAADLANQCDRYVRDGRTDEMYESVLRDLLLAGNPHAFGFEDVTGLPWIEIDFPEDVNKARTVVLRQLEEATNPA